MARPDADATLCPHRKCERMPVTIQPYWESALWRLRLALSTETMSERLLANSNERVQRYREHLEHAAARSKYRSSSFREPLTVATG